MTVEFTNPYEAPEFWPAIAAQLGAARTATSAEGLRDHAAHPRRRRRGRLRILRRVRRRHPALRRPRRSRLVIRVAPRPNITGR